MPTEWPLLPLACEGWVSPKPQTTRVAMWVRQQPPSESYQRDAANACWPDDLLKSFGRSCKPLKGLESAGFPRTDCRPGLKEWDSSTEGAHASPALKCRRFRVGRSTKAQQRSAIRQPALKWTCKVDCETVEQNVLEFRSTGAKSCTRLAHKS